MAFDLTTKGLRDREYSKFVPLQAGSQTTVNINLNNNVKVYEFPVGSIRALNTDAGGGPVSGGNFESWTHYRIHGLFYGIEYQYGDFIAGGSIFLKTSGTVETDLWGNYGTRATNENFTVFPRGEAVGTTDLALSGLSATYELIPVSGILHLIGSDLGETKSGAAFRIAYI